MKKRNNIYLEAAQRIDMDMDMSACYSINETSRGLGVGRYPVVAFEKMFRPTEKERIQYRHHYGFWLQSYTEMRAEARNTRVLALLFMDQIINDK